MRALLRRIRCWVLSAHCRVFRLAGVRGAGWCCWSRRRQLGARLPAPGARAPDLRRRNGRGDAATWLGSVVSIHLRSGRGSFSLVSSMWTRGSVPTGAQLPSLPSGFWVPQVLQVRPPYLQKLDSGGVARSEAGPGKAET